MGTTRAWDVVARALESRIAARWPSRQGVRPASAAKPRRVRVTGWLGALALAAAAPAQAVVVLAMTFSDSTSELQETPTPVPLNDASVTITPAFSVPAGAKLIVSYTAQCAISGNSNNEWVDIDIRIVNAATGEARTLPPTNSTRDAFCASHGSTGVDGDQMHAISGVALGLPEGSYRVQVFARVTSGFASLGFSSLVVWR